MSCEIGVVEHMDEYTDELTTIRQKFQNLCDAQERLFESAYHNDADYRAAFQTHCKSIESLQQDLQHIAACIKFSVESDAATALTLESSLQSVLRSLTNKLRSVEPDCL